MTVLWKPIGVVRLTASNAPNQHTKTVPLTSTAAQSQTIPPHQRQPSNEVILRGLRVPSRVRQSVCSRVTCRLVVVTFWMGAINCTILLVAAMMKPKSVAPVSWMNTLNISP